MVGTWNPAKSRERAKKGGKRLRPFRLARSGTPRLFEKENNGYIGRREAIDAADGSYTVSAWGRVIGRAVPIDRCQNVHKISETSPSAFASLASIYQFPGARRRTSSIDTLEPRMRFSNPSFWMEIEASIS